MNKEVNNDRYSSRKNPILYIVPCLLCLLTLLTGCVSYDVGVHFDSPYDGSIVQHIQISDSLADLDRSATKEWFNSIEDRAYKLRGKVKRVSSEELVVDIPFNNSKELVDKFNQFFYGDTSPTAPSSSTDLATINSQMSLRQSNFLLFERNYFNLKIDLRALGNSSEENKISIDTNSLVNLTFQVNSPWIARSFQGKNLLTPVKNTPGKLIWQLQPGQINQIKAVVWLPSPLGIGAAIIIVLMIAGFYIKYRHFPGVAPSV